MGIISRLCLATYFVYWLIFSTAYAQALTNNGSAMVFGGMRGGSLGRPSAPTYSTGSYGVRAGYNQPIKKFPPAANSPTFNPRVTATTPKGGVLKGIKGFLKSPLGRANIYTTIILWGLSEYAERQGWFFENNDAYILDLSVEQPIEKGWNTHPQGFGQSYNTVKSYINDIPECSREYYAPCSSFLAQNKKDVFITGKNERGSWLLYNVSECPTGAVLTGLGCVSQEKRPVTDADIDNLFNSPDLQSWSPLPGVPQDEVKKVYPHISPADTSIEVAPSTIQYPTETTTAPDGTVKQQSKKETATVANLNTDPALVTTTETTVETFEDGQKTDTQTTAETTDASNASQQENPQQAQEQITDCELVPTLCATQKEQLEQDKKRDEWFKEPVPDEPDLGALAPKEIPIKKDVTIEFGSKTCPSAVSLNLSAIRYHGSFDFSLICDFAIKLRIILLAVAYLIAARILVGALK